MNIQTESVALPMAISRSQSTIKCCPLTSFVYFLKVHHNALITLSLPAYIARFPLSLAHSPRPDYAAGVVNARTNAKTLLLVFLFLSS